LKDGSSKVKVSHNGCWSEVEYFVDCPTYSITIYFFGAKRFHENRDRAGDTNRVGDLNLTSISGACRY